MKINNLLKEIYSNNNMYLKQYLQSEEIDPYEMWDLWLEHLENEGEDLSFLQKLAKSKNIDITEPELYYSLPPLWKNNYTEYYNLNMEEYVPHQEWPSWKHMSLKKNKLIPRNTWLIHFTDNPGEIMRNGFKVGMFDMTKLGLTTYYKNDGDSKKHGGYNFAFTADDRNVSTGTKYGKHAIMFRNSGVHVYHYGDEENQVIFYGPEVDRRTMVELYNDGGEWNVIKFSNGNPVYKGDIKQAIQWVEQNYDQYRRVLSPQK